jgi:hypothetical protein
VDRLPNNDGTASSPGGITYDERAGLTPASFPPSKAALCLGFLALALLFNNLGADSLPSFDDAYHAQTAKEMLRSGDPITITYDGAPSFQSSPLPLWLIASSYMIFGTDEYAARLPTAVLAFATLVMIYFFARRRWGEEAALAAAFILLTTTLFMRYGRHVMAEVPLAFFCTAALLAFAEAQRRPAFYYLFGAMTGLAILTKSALGLLPAIIAVAFLLLTGKFRELIKPAFLLSALVAVGIATVWYGPALVMHRQAFIDSHIGAYLATHVINGHHAGLGLWGLVFYLIWIPIQYLPWTLPLLPALWWGMKDRREDAVSLLLWLAAILPVILLTFVSSKYTRYLIPIFPAAALLIASSWSRRLPAVWLGRMRAAIGWTSAIAAVALIALPLNLGLDRNADLRALSAEVKATTAEQINLLNLDLDFYEIQNPLLFYADRPFSFHVARAEQIWRGIKPGETGYGLGSTAGFDALPAPPDGIEIKSEGRHGSLVFFSIHGLSEEEWAAEIKQLAELIVDLDAPEQLGCYRLPRALIARSLTELTGRKLLPPDDKPRRMVRALERHGLLYGLSSVRGFEEDLRKLPHGLPRIVKTAATAHLVLFRIESAQEGS